MKPICKKCNKHNCVCDLGLDNKPQNITHIPCMPQNKLIKQYVDKVPDIDHRLLDKVVKIIQTDNVWYVQLDSGQYYRVPDINVIRKEKRYKILEHTLSKETDEEGNEVDNWILDILDSDQDNFPVDMKDFISWMSKKFKFTAQQDPNDPNTYIFINEDGDEITRLTVGDEDTDISAYKGIYDEDTGLITITLRDNKTMQDAATFTIDVGYLKNAPDKYATDLHYAPASSRLNLQLSDGTELSTDLPRKIVTNIEQNGDKITVTFQDGTTVELTVSTGNKVGVTGVDIVENDDNTYTLIVEYADGTHTETDITPFMNKVINTVINRVIDALGKSRIITVDTDYTVQQTDYDGNTVVRCNKTTVDAGSDIVTQRITVVKPDTENFVGKYITFRKVNNNLNSLLYLDCATGVTILPDDISPIRRAGNEVSLRYVGNGVFDACGELS